MRPEPESTLSLSEVAARLRRTPHQVLELIEGGELRFAPTGDIDAIRVPESALAEFLALFGEWGHPSDHDDPSG